MDTQAISLFCIRGFVYVVVALVANPPAQFDQYLSTQIWNNGHNTPCIRSVTEVHSNNLFIQPYTVNADIIFSAKNSVIG